MDLRAELDSQWSIAESERIQTKTIVRQHWTKKKKATEEKWIS
jgi:hypothetical protein